MQHATWISPSIQAAYTAWHKAGAAHSVETWIDGQLAGGLYGVCLGRFFFGESMFSRSSDASKLALAYLVDFLLARGIRHIDCQQQTGHLRSEEHTSELQSLMHISYAVFCLKNKKYKTTQIYR